MRSKLLVWLALAILLVGTVSALGIAPGHTDIIFEPNAQQTVKLKLVNTGGQELQVVLYADGELAPYISFEQPLIQFSQGEEEKYANYTIKLPTSFDKQGPHTADIVARGLPPPSKPGEKGMSASVAIASKLNVMVPYSGSYAEINLFSPSFEQGKESNFVVEVRNLGTEDLLQAQLVIDVLGPLNNRITLLKSGSFNLASKQSKIVPIKWTPDIGLGNYKAVATLIYNGVNAKDEKTFTIGNLGIEIVDISVKDFKLGNIAMFNIMLQNNWNENISGVYGDITIKDDSGKKYTNFKTASVNLGQGDKQPIQAYWDTKTVGPGKYKLDVILNYLGKSSEKIFDILVSLDKIDTNLGGMAITEQEKTKGFLVYGIYLVIFLLIITIIIVIKILIALKKLKVKK
jgi:hypothetical protein